MPVTGQLVDLRRRRFVVQDVERSALEPSVLWEGAPALSPLMRSIRGPHHIVKLASVEDDGLGETISSDLGARSRRTNFGAARHARSWNGR